MTTPLDPVRQATEAAVRATQAIPGVGELTGLIETVSAARRWLSDRHNWIRVLWVSSGFTLMVVGAAILARRPLLNAGGQAAGTVAAGAAGKAAGAASKAV